MSSFLLHSLRLSITLNRAQNEKPQNDITSCSYNQQATVIPTFHTTVAQAALSTAGSSIVTAFAEEFNGITTSIQTSNTPNQLLGSSSHAPADFESLFASTEDLLKPLQELSYKPSSSSAISTNQKSGDTSSENHVYSIDLIKKILKGNLADFARSTDTHHLLISLMNLRNSPHLNSQQVEIIHDYIENFDSLVAYHPFYEQQIDMGTSALVYNSIEEKQRGIASLKPLYQSLKKRLHEIKEEEDRIRASVGLVYTDLMAKKGELETDINVFSKAKSRQEEAMAKVKKASDAWEKLRNLFT